jgi:hypothetical protein
LRGHSLPSCDVVNIRSDMPALGTGAASIVSDCALGDRGSNPKRAKNFPFSFCVRQALVSTQPLIQWVPGARSPGSKAMLGRDADHSPLSSAEVKNKQELYLLSPQPPMVCSGTGFIFIPPLPHTSHGIVLN